MKRGEKAKPAALRIALGDHSGRPNRGDRPVPRSGLPVCPKWLDRMAREHWRWLVGELEYMGVVSLVDGDALAAYCDTWSRWRRAVRTLAEKGSTCDVLDGEGRVKYVQQRPEVSIARSLLVVLNKYQREFGITPASRGKVMVNANTVPGSSRVTGGIAEKLGYSAQVG